MILFVPFLRNINVFIFIFIIIIVIVNKTMKDECFFSIPQVLFAQQMGSLQLLTVKT